MQHLLNQLRPILQLQQELMAIQAPLPQEQVNETPEQYYTDTNRIDHLMDDLLVVIPHGRCVEDVERLNNYLSTLDTEAADYYTEQLKEYAP